MFHSVLHLFYSQAFYRHKPRGFNFDILLYYMGFFSEIKSALEEIFSSFSQPVIWRGREMNAVIAEGQEAVELESGGFVPDSTFNMKFLESELDGETPRIGEIVEYNSKQYRIHWVSVRSNRGQVEITLKPIDK